MLVGRGSSLGEGKLASAVRIQAGSGGEWCGRGEWLLLSVVRGGQGGRQRAHHLVGRRHDDDVGCPVAGRVWHGVHCRGEAVRRLSRPVGRTMRRGSGAGWFWPAVAELRRVLGVLVGAVLCVGVLGVPVGRLGRVVGVLCSAVVLGRRSRVGARSARGVGVGVVVRVVERRAGVVAIRATRRAVAAVARRAVLVRAALWRVTARGVTAGSGVSRAAFTVILRWWLLLFTSSRGQIPPCPVRLRRPCAAVVSRPDVPSRPCVRGRRGLSVVGGRRHPN